MKNDWPQLDFSEINKTVQTVHLWAQIVGKVRLRHSPWLNHSWHVTLYISPTGFTTGSIPYEGGIFEINFDFHRDMVEIKNSEGASAQFNLTGLSVARFYSTLLDKLRSIGIT